MKTASRRTSVAHLSVIGLLAGLTAACGGVVDSDRGTAAKPDLPDAALVAPITAMECDEGTAPSGEPVVIGGSLPLTGPASSTGQVHAAVAELVTDWVNDCGGIDGRPLEWKVYDDQGDPTRTSTSYDRLLSSDKVDFVMGPVGPASILAAAGPVTRAGYAYPTHTNGAPGQLIGENHFPAWQIGGGVDDPAHMWDAQADVLVDALESSGNPPKSVFYAAAKAPGTLAITEAGRSALEAMGAETTGSVDYQVGTTDFNSVALRASSEDPDLVYIGGLGADATHLYDAFNSIGYRPRSIFVALPSPSSIEAIGSDAEGLLTSSIYEHHAPLSDNGIAAYFAQQYSEVAAQKSLSPIIETQAAASLAAWQILLTGIVNAGLDNKAVVEWLNGHEVETLVGSASFDGYNNYGTDFNRITQIQDGKRVLVWPEDVAGAEIEYRP